MARYEDLRVWWLAHDLARKVRCLTRGFPREERYELASQLRRAALSVPCNLVEGSGQQGARMFLRYTRIAIGSLREVEYLLLMSRDESYISEEDHTALKQEIGHVRVLLHRLAAALEKAGQ